MTLSLEAEIGMFEEIVIKAVLYGYGMGSKCKVTKEVTCAENQVLEKLTVI